MRQRGPSVSQLAEQVRQHQQDLLGVPCHERLRRHDRDVRPRHPPPLLGRGGVSDRGHRTWSQAGRCEHGDRTGSGTVEPGAVVLALHPGAEPGDVIDQRRCQLGHGLRVACTGGQLFSLQLVDGGGFVRRARPTAGGEQEHRTAVEVIAARRDDGQPGFRKQSACGGDAVIGEVPVPQGVPLATTQRRRIARELQHQRSVVAQCLSTGPQGAAWSLSCISP